MQNPNQFTRRKKITTNQDRIDELNPRIKIV